MCGSYVLMSSPKVIGESLKRATARVSETPNCWTCREGHAATTMLEGSFTLGEFDFLPRTCDLRICANVERLEAGLSFSAGSGMNSLTVFEAVSARIGWSRERIEAP